MLEAAFVVSPSRCGLTDGEKRRPQLSALGQLQAIKAAFFHVRTWVKSLPPALVAEFRRLMAWKRT